MNRTKFIAVFYGWLMICILLLLFAFIMTIVIKLTSINELTIVYVSFAFSILSMFIGGVVVGLKGKGYGWLLGAITGFGFILCIYIIQLTFLKVFFSWHQYIYHISFILATIFGSIVGVNIVSTEGEN